MAVSILLPPETIWGYDKVTKAYSGKPKESWRRIADHVKEMYLKANERNIIRLIGKEPEE